MSDAITDIARDDDMARIRAKISNAEANFATSPSKEKAKNLIKLWQEYISMPSGYCGAPSKSMAYEQIGYLLTYLETGDTGWLTDDSAGTNPNEFNGTISVGNGFITTNNIESWLKDRIYQYRPDIIPYNRKYKINLQLDSIEELSCKHCPYLNNLCGPNFHCNSKNLGELAVRRQMICKGKDGNE